MDVEAAERMNTFNIQWLIEPLLTGNWPDMMKQAAGDRLPDFKPQESESLKNSIDFIGAVHKTYYKVSYKEIQKDVTGQSFYKDVNVTAERDWTARRTSANYQRVTTSGDPARATLQYLGIS